MYTTGIIPPKLPSTPTTDITDEITERESFDKPHNFRHTPDPYRGDSQDNNEEDAEDSEPMSEIQQHNRDRSAIYNFKSGVRDYGTQSEERSTRTIGTMSEPIKTRNSGNEAQPQSSATQTSGLLQQQLPYNLREQDEINFKPSTSQRSQYDSRTNGYYPSQRSTSHDHRNKYVSSSSIPPRKKDYLDYDQHQVPHSLQYNDDPDDQYVVTRNDYERSTKHQPRSSSQTRRYNPSSTNIHRTPSPPVEYRSTLPTHQHRSRSPSTPIQKHKQTSTNGHRAISPPSQRRSRQLQRSPSPPTSRHHISSMTQTHRTPSPPIQYRSISPKNYSRKTKDRPQMVSTETDTSLDGMRPQHHQGVQQESPATREYGVSANLEKQHPSHTNYPTDLNTKSMYSQYETLNPSLPKRQDYITISPYRDNYQLLQNDQRSSAQKNYQQRPERNNSYNNNYEEIPSKYDQSISPEYTRSFDRTKEHTSRPYLSNHQQQLNRAVEQTLDDEEQQATLTFYDEGNNEEYIRQLPTGGSISIPSTTVYQPDTLPRTSGQNKSPTHQKQDSVNNRRKIPEFSLHHGQQRATSIIDSPVYNIGTQNILYQSPNNEVTIPFQTRYIHDSDVDDEFTTTNNNIRSSTLKRDSLISRNSRILLLPVLNSSRTYVFEKQSLPKNHIRQSKINGNFYLAASPTLRSLNTSFQNDESEIDPLTQMIDSTNLNGHGLRSQVA